MRYATIIIATAAFAAPALAQTALTTVTAPAVSVRSQVHAAAVHAAATSIVEAGSRASVSVASPNVTESFPVLPRASWAPQDPADVLWRRARELLNNDNFERAAVLYSQIRTDSRYARSAYRAPSYYWEAFARERVGTSSELRSALRVLAQLKRDHPNYDGMSQANVLEASINGRLAQLGDAQATAATTITATQAATQQCDEVQLAALEALMHMPQESSLPILRNVMQRRNCDRMREFAVMLLAQSRSPEAQEILLDAIKNDPNRKVKEQALLFLAQVPDDRALDALEAVINGNDPQMLQAAAFAVSQHRSPRATELLRRLATRNDLSAEMRSHALFSLSQRPDADINPLLRTMYSETTDPKLKEVILMALSQRRDQANGEFMFQIALNGSETREVRQQALHYAAQQRTFPVAQLAQLYREMTDREMRTQILVLLSQSRNPDAIPQLIEILRVERDVELRKSIIFWLGQSKDPRALRAIAEIVGGG